ncbi:hypothetical protein [Mucilaginibacter sp.]|uniref:hypothetical protein n=1 Tax=Mucilaginibacter sp. TaxID=1882438 RepID=UPI002611E663|nr:hypothetical protein [Mucilaginibacter sp.]
MQKYTERYFNVKAKYKKLQKLRPTKLYNGKETKRYIKSLDLLVSKEKAYKALWSQDATPVAVQKLMPKELIEGIMYSGLFQ